jgi:hypothetical protein
MWWVKTFSIILFVLYAMFMLEFLNIFVMNFVCGPTLVGLVWVWVSCCICSLVFIVDTVLSSSWGSYLLCIF